MPPLPFPGAHALPIVGQPCRVHGWFPTIQLTCTCQPNPTPMLIVGFGGFATCPDCGERFAIRQISHDGESGTGAVNLAAIGKAPAPGTVQ